MNKSQTNEKNAITNEEQQSESSRSPMRSKMLLIFGFGAVILLGAVLLFQMRQAEPQELPPPKSPITIGVLRYLPFHDDITAGLKESLSEKGYIEGEDIIYIISEVGFTPDKTRELAKAFIEQDVDLIFALASVSAQVAVEETAAAGRTDIPIVMSHALNTLNLGIIDSYQSSGNNLTGIEVNFQELTGKKLEFLKRFGPEIKKIGVLDVINETGRGPALIISKLEKDAPVLGLEVVFFPIESLETGPELTQELETVMGNIKPGDIDAYMHAAQTFLSPSENRQIIIDAVNQLKIPSVWITPPEVKSGGLMTYQYDLKEMGYQSAEQVEKVLLGVQPTDIPIEFAENHKLFMNFNTVRETGIIVPESLLEIVDVRFE